MSYWVIDGSKYIAKIEMLKGSVRLSNGLVSREIDSDTCTTKSFKNIVTDEEFISGNIPDFAFTCNNKRITNGYTFVEARQSQMIKAVDYYPNASMSEVKEYPPKGCGVDMVYKYDKLVITVHYEIYDGIPTIGKRVSIKNTANDKIVIDNISTDILPIDCINNLFVDSNFNSAMEFLGLKIDNYAKHYARHRYGVLEVAPQYRMNIEVSCEEVVDSIIAYETPFTAPYYESRLIEVKSVYRVLAPWTLDCALFFHLISNSTRTIKRTVDQCKEVGLEMIIQSFGSGVNMESRNKAYLNRIKKAYQYGKDNGLRMGAYTLAYVKNYSPVRSHEALNHDYSHICRCLANDWADKYTRDVLNFIDVTNADAIEIDGPYGMLLCAGGKTHHHADFTDSQYKQWKHAVIDWYKEIRSRNVYINAPDWHFLCGTNRTGVGYEEIAFSEKRLEQLITSRIYYYKGTFAKNPSQGWGFLPLSVYHGGGNDAKFSPTDKNAFEYDWALAQCVASGVWPTLRGRSVYDCTKGKEILSKWVAIFKKYRSAINGTTVHFMPPRIDKDDFSKTTTLDAIMNLTPCGENRGFLMLFNQTSKAISKTINVPLYYAGLTDLDSPPPPVDNTKNSDVEYPLYGQELTPLMINAREKNAIPLIKDNPVEDMPVPVVAAATLTDCKAIFVKNDLENMVVTVDSNGNAPLQVDMPPMSYCYYVIKSAK